MGREGEPGGGEGEPGAGRGREGGQVVKLVVIWGKSETRMTASILEPDP